MNFISGGGWNVVLTSELQAAASYRGTPALSFVGGDQAGPKLTWEGVWSSGCLRWERYKNASVARDRS